MPDRIVHSRICSPAWRWGMREIREDHPRGPHEAKDEDFHSVGEWLSEQGFTDEESMYYIEDGVTVRIMTGEEELKTLGD